MFLVKQLPDCQKDHIAVGPLAVEWITKALEELKQTHRLRVPKSFETTDATTAKLNGKPILVFCSNDYLGLRHDPTLRNEILSRLQTQPNGPGASRLVSGDSLLLQNIEENLASFTGNEAVLLASSGYAANVGAISALADREDVLFSDELNHASIIDGARLSRAKIVVYPHADPSQLRRLVHQNRPFRRGWILSESLFSMDGDTAPIKELAIIANEEGLHFYLDEAHSLGVFGPNGRGFSVEQNVKPDVVLGTIGKALGATGAFIAGSNALKSYLWNRSRSFVFSTGISIHSAIAANAAIRLLEQSDLLQTKLQQNISYTRQELQKRGLPTRGDPRSPIIPLVIGADEDALRVSATLLEQGIFVQAIRPPTVPKNTARLRITVSAKHTHEQIDQLINTLQRIV